MSSGLSILGVVWLVAAVGAAVFGWRHGNWIVTAIGIVMIVIAGWNAVAHLRARGL